MSTVGKKLKIYCNEKKQKLKEIFFFKFLGNFSVSKKSLLANFGTFFGHILTHCDVLSQQKRKYPAFFLYYYYHDFFLYHYGLSRPSFSLIFGSFFPQFTVELDVRMRMIAQTTK